MFVLGPNGPIAITTYNKFCREDCQLSSKVSIADVYFRMPATSE